MARSIYIYIVTSNSGIDSAFTVKYEMQNSLPKSLYAFNELGYKIFRFKDGGKRSEVVEITEKIRKLYV